jgi:hypothetical protein
MGTLAKLELSRAADARESRLDDGGGVLGHVEEDGEIEREPGLAALGCTANS